VSGGSGRPDLDHLASARRLGRVLLTCDEGFLDERNALLTRNPALIVFDFGSGTPDEIVAAFRCFDAMPGAPSPHNWGKIDARPDGWTEYRRRLDGSVSRERFRLADGKLQTWAEG
jgi:hypothetical protein